MTDHDLAARLATEAGRLLLRVRDELAEASGSERKQLVTSDPTTS